MSSQATASPARQRRTSTATTWASSNPHSLELLVSGRPVQQITPTSTPQQRYVFVVPKVQSHFRSTALYQGKQADSERKANADLNVPSILNSAPLLESWPQLTEGTKFRVAADEHRDPRSSAYGLSGEVATKSTCSNN